MLTHVVLYDSQACRLSHGTLNAAGRWPVSNHASTVYALGRRGREEEGASLAAMGAIGYSFQCLEQAAAPHHHQNNIGQCHIVEWRMDMDASVSTVALKLSQHRRDTCALWYGGVAGRADCQVMPGAQARATALHSDIPRRKQVGPETCAQNRLVSSSGAMCASIPWQATCTTPRTGAVESAEVELDAGTHLLCALRVL